MISAIRGTVDADGSVLTAGGVGYDVSCPEPLEEGAEVSLKVVSTVNREGLIRLWGFGSTAERDLFVALTGVPSVGPVAAMSVLRHAGASKLVSAVKTQDAALLRGVPGVGAGTVAKILSLLKLPASAHAVPDSTTAPGEVQSQAERGLVALGYPQGAVRQAIEQAAASQTTLSGVTQDALRILTEVA